MRLLIKSERELVTLVGYAPIMSPSEYALASGSW
ncbi:hypothetical protein [Massilia aquatica]